MPISVVTGAMITCSFGMAPSTLNALPTPRVMIEGKPAAVITSTIMGANIPPFGMCSSLANPTVAAATAAALGILTPMPCIPTIVSPWAPGAAKTVIGGIPALVSGSMCNCAYGGVVTIGMPGAMKTMAN